MMRSHGESSRREIWEFGKKGEPIYDAIEKAIRMRYKLLPYIYSTAWQVTSNNDSFMRALIMDFPADKKVWDIPDEFMFGRSLLVAPVTHALFTSTEERKWSEETVNWTRPEYTEVYLPAGANWYDWHSGKLYKGGQTITAEAPIDRCPLYVKAGSIIPLGPDVQYAAEKPWNDIEIRIYGGADGQFTFYDDEKDNYNYEKGRYCTIDFKLKGRTLTIGKRNGSYSGMPAFRTFRLVYIDGKRTVTKNVTYSGTAVNISF